MNGTIFWRLVWKEYRVQRAFWIGMAALALLLNLIVLSFLHWHGVKESDWLFRVALGLGAAYALGCAGTLFATEHEAETFSFQRALPVSALRLFAAKITFALASTAAMLGLGWLIAAVVSGWRLPAPHIESALWGMWGVAAVEFLAWGVFFSLLSQRPLVAVMLAVTCALLTVNFLPGGRTSLDSWDFAGYATALPGRAIVVVILALADLWLGYRWFREPRARAHGLNVLLTLRVRKLRHAERDEYGEATIAADGRSDFARLVWHHLRQSATLLLTFIVLATPMAIGVWLFWLGPAGLGPRLERLMQPSSTAVVPWYVFFPLYVVAVWLTPSLMGACVFLADQSRSSFRFLAERGIQPRWVWLSRQLVWLVPLVLGAAAVLAPMRYPPDPEGVPVPLIFFGYAILAYACGQFFSMFVRSGILAVALGLGLTFALCFWVTLMLEIHMSWWWSVAPIAVALFTCTWLRTGDWLVERRGVKPALRACWPLGLASAGILAAVPTVRVYEVRQVDPGFSPDQYARPRTAEEEATLAIYRQAVKAMDTVRGRPTPTAADKALVAKHPKELTPEGVAQNRVFEPALALALEASRHPACDFFKAFQDDVSPTDVHNLAVLLSFSAEELEIDGQLDAAWERYLGVLRIAGHLRHRASDPKDADGFEAGVRRRLPEWAARPGQTSKRVLAAMRQLDETIAKLPSRSDAIKSNYVVWERYFHADPQALMANYDTRESFLLRLAVRCLFWERARSLRILNLWTAEELAGYESVEKAAAAGGVIRFPFHYLRPERGWDPHRGWQWWSAVNRDFIWGSGDLASYLYNGLIEIETQRRATRLLMALEAWKLDHGKLPKSLEELRGKYLEQIPTDTLWGQPFAYFPQGLPPTPDTGEPRKGTVAPGQPCIAAPWGNVTERALVVTPAGPQAVVRSVPPPTAGQIAASGWVFPIP